jgi:hypothetical protein
MPSASDTALPVSATRAVSNRCAINISFRLKSR